MRTASPIPRGTRAGRPCPSRGSTSAIGDNPAHPDDPAGVWLHDVDGRPTPGEAGLALLDRLRAQPALGAKPKVVRQRRLSSTPVRIGAVSLLPGPRAARRCAAGADSIPRHRSVPSRLQGQCDTWHQEPDPWPGGLVRTRPHRRCWPCRVETRASSADPRQERPSPTAIRPRRPNVNSQSGRPSVPPDLVSPVLPLEPAATRASRTSPRAALRAGRSPW